VAAVSGDHQWEGGHDPLFSEFDNAIMRDYVQGYIAYPNGIAMLSQLGVD
jgi:hypothetical protein